jgi:hypothetical protein
MMFQHDLLEFIPFGPKISGIWHGRSVIRELQEMSRDKSEERKYKYTTLQQIK